MMWLDGSSTCFESENLFDGTGFNIKFDGVEDIDIWRGISEGPGIVGDDVRNFVGSHGSLCDSAKFICSLFISDLSQHESSFDINQNSIIFPYSREREHVHEAQWELDVLDHPIVHESVAALLSADHDRLLTVQSELEVVSRRG